MWSGWGIDATSVGCALRNDYYDPLHRKPIRQGFLVDTKFFRAHMLFKAHTFTHGDIITKDELGIIRYVLQIEPVTAQIKDNEKISKAVIGGFESKAEFFPTRDTHFFRLSEVESLDLMQMFGNNEIVDFSLIFTNGETRTFKIFPSGNFNGHVWVAMFNTCIKEHVRRRTG